MAISATGSGIDIPSLVASLVSSSRAPTEQRITTVGTAVNAKLSAVGQVRNAMANLQTALNRLSTSADKPAFKATTGADAGFTATAATGAVPGSYSVRIDALAGAQKLASAGHAQDAAPGSGTLRFAWGEDQSLEVEIGEGATLADIANAVNRAAAGKGVGATVVTSSQGQQLVFTAAETGLANKLTITAEGGDGGLQALTNGPSGGLTETVAATDAVVFVDGLERRSSSNSVADLVPGTTLDLTRVTEGTQTLRIAQDNEALSANVAAFVTAYNSVVSTLKSSSSYNATTKSAAALNGDSLVRTLQQQLRGQIGEQSGSLKALGVTAGKDGLLSFSASDFAVAIAADPVAAKSVFGAEGGYTANLSTLLKDNLDSISGSLVKRTEGLNKQVSDLEKQLDALDVRMTRLSSLYTAQFTAMEMMVVQMQSSSSSLNSLLSSNSNN
ncbi:flagellar hook-associated protein 2 [Luteimonas terrae]|uniref:Flagellar hook-associated protein 2 n=2 Tax=Luteimonas terrae TaxID=1530191 RepID=A0ABU1XVD6_9GAMM|nr:flagellar filament capping protein FliD [Luteimonas terrae]MDR7192568.1 flagellar hook-associated protein 2 [Luteimonas terrae]